MLKADMVEAQTGEVVTQDIEEKTMEKLLEFIYTGEIDNMDDQLEMLLYAADYYEILGLVSEGREDFFLIEEFQIQVCKSALSQEDVTPKNATNILLLADRHSLNELKKVNQDNKKIFTYILIFLNSKTQRVIAWILAEKEKYMADEDFTKEMEKQPALLMEILKA